MNEDMSHKFLSFVPSYGWKRLNEVHQHGCVKSAEGRQLAAWLGPKGSRLHFNVRWLLWLNGAGQQKLSSTKRLYWMFGQIHNLVVF